MSKKDIIYTNICVVIKVQFKKLAEPIAMPSLEIRMDFKFQLKSHLDNVRYH